MVELTVILIARNQVWNVPRLVESVLEHTQAAASREIVLVDSASTDGTVEAAKEYPIGVIRLNAAQRLTAAAGRYVGCKHTSGQYVLFLDGDMELCAGWLEQALAVMKDDPQIGVLTGQVIDRPTSTPRDDKYPISDKDGALRDVLHGGGAAMYQRSVLEEVGMFTPYIYSDEEPELCVRIRHRGYRVVRIERPMALHYSDPSEAISTLFARWRRRLYLGAGQNLRQHAGTSVFWPYLRERGFGCIPLIGLAIGLVAAVFFILTGDIRPFMGWLLLLGAIILADTLRKRSLYRAIYSLTLRILIADGTLRGFFLSPLKPQDYLDNVEVVQPIA